MNAVPSATVPHPAPAARPCTGLVLRAERHSDRTALVTPDGSRLSHRELADLVARRAAEWGPSRRLVLVEGSRSLAQVVTYLAALEHGHVALVVPEGRDHTEILATWQPDIVALASPAVGHVEVVRTTSAHDLHPDLALLLSTSGSTGSPKLVRLSADAVRSNAEAIAEYLALAHDDVALSTLPLHYCYGLSVLHSHLAVGGAVALTEHSVVDPCFWDLAERVAATSLAGVPHTFELLNRSPFTPGRLPSLRRFTQAGGRLAPEAVTRWAERGRREGWDLVVMYGATEATARMAWLPPEHLTSRPGSIGRAIPGGRLSLAPVPECTDPGVGELVYSGPNVMLGYATQTSDLAHGREVTELRTGDLAREVDGLFEVVGRRNRQVKLFGLRLDLDRLERHLATPDRHGAHGVATWHTVATDQSLHLFGSHGRSLAATREAAAAFCGLPLSAVHAHVLPHLPRTPSGKPDLAALKELAALTEARATEGGATTPGPGAETSVQVRVRAAYVSVLARPDLVDSDSFVELGGDSLSYVELATRLERILPGPLPAGWHQLPLSAIGAETAPSRPSRTSSIDTVVALRAGAILAIVASHVDLIDFKGGAHLLLVLAGFNVARFQLGTSQRGRRVRHVLTGLLQVVLTSVLWIGAVSVFTRAYDVPTVFLTNQVFGSPRWNDQWQFWFLEVLVWTTLGLAALVAIPWFHHWETRRPFEVALGLLALAMAMRAASVGWQAGASERYTLTATAFFVALGWVAARADTPRRRLVAALLGAVSVAGFFGEPVREAVVMLGLALVVTLPRLPCPAWLLRPASAVAAASLSIYLTHWLVYPPLEDAGWPWLALAAALTLGLGHAYLSRPLNRALSRLSAGVGASTGRAGAPDSAPLLPATPDRSEVAAFR